MKVAVIVDKLVVMAEEVTKAEMDIVMAAMVNAMQRLPLTPALMATTLPLPCNFLMNNADKLDSNYYLVLHNHPRVEWPFEQFVGKLPTSWLLFNSFTCYYMESTLSGRGSTYNATPGQP